MGAILRRALALGVVLISHAVAAGPPSIDDFPRRVVASVPDTATLDPAAHNGAGDSRPTERLRASRQTPGSSRDPGAVASLGVVVEASSPGIAAKSLTTVAVDLSGAGIALSKSTQLRPLPDGLPAAIEAKTDVPMPKLGGRLATFVENKGQWDERAKFQFKTGGKIVWLTDSGVMFDSVRIKTLQQPGNSAPAIPRLNDQRVVQERVVFAEDFVGAHSTPTIEPTSMQPGTYNYLVGSDPTKWHTNVRGFAEVVYRNVWDGVDVRLAGSGANIEQEFVVHPGADLSQIQIAYRGIDGLEVATDGSLVVHTTFGDVRESAPRIYQEVDGQRIYVSGRFRLTGATSYSFEIEATRPQYALVIDPTLLYSSYLGGSSSDEAHGVAVDSMGNAYVTGLTQSLDFPTTVGSYQPRPILNQTGPFVTKISPLGDQLVYSTYLGSGGGAGNAIAVDSAGDAYVTGQVVNAGFPTTPTALIPTATGNGLAFFTKLNAAGNALIYSTLLGPANGLGVAIGPNGNAYITGDAFGIPTTPTAYQPTFGGGSTSAHGDACLIVLDPSASGSASLVYSTYLGGSDQDIGFGVAVDSAGAAYVTGFSASTNFPTTPGAFQHGFAAVAKAFVAKINPGASGSSSLIYSTSLGGSSGSVTVSQAIAVDASLNAYVTGYTVSASDFPVTPGAFQGNNPTAVCGNNANPGCGFVTKLNAGGSSLVYSTLLGAAPTFGTGLAVDTLGNAYVTGWTRTANFPVTADAFQRTHSLNEDVFLTKLNSTGTGLVYSTFVGGAGRDFGFSVALDQAGDAYVTGSANIGFPTTPFAFQFAPGGSGQASDGFVAKFALATLTQLSIQGATPSHGGNSGVATITIVGSGFVAGAAIKLACPAQPDILGADVEPTAGGRTLTAAFNLVGANPGVCNLIATNPDGTAFTFLQGFTIDPGGAPDIWVDLVGLPGLRVGQPQYYYLMYGNRGNIDSPTVRVWVSFDSFLSGSPAANPCSQGQLNGRNYFAFDVSPSAGSSGVIPIGLSAPSTASPHQPFLIQAWEELR